MNRQASIRHASLHAEKAAVNPPPHSDDVVVLKFEDESEKESHGHGHGKGLVNQSEFTVSKDGSMVESRKKTGTPEFKEDHLQGGE
jgi:hypothetical protein